MTPSSAGSSAPPSAGWWGDGPAPWETWPGVSLRLEADWSEERGRWESRCGRYYFDPDAAENPSLSARYFKPPRGSLAGQPMEYLPWQLRLVILPLFGWLRVRDGLRRFRRVFVEVPKKNGKSIFCSALGPHLAFCDHEPGAHVYVAAGDEEQARIVWGDSAEMLRESPDFMRDAGVEVLANAVVQARTASTFRPLTAKAATKHGFDVHGLIFDELHAQKSRTLYEVLKRGISARRQPVILVITTAGDNRESICYEEHEYALRVLKGSVEDEELLPVVFQPAKDDDWADPDVWRRVNPGLGTVKQLDYMESECRQAQAEPRKRNDFLRLELNIWTESSEAWIPVERFAPLARPADEREPAWLAGLTCAVGLDLSATTDLTCCVVAFRQQDDAEPAEEVEVDEGDDRGHERRVVRVDYRVHLLEHYWLPLSKLKERERSDNVPYGLWAEQGWLTATDGEIVDYEAIRRHVLAIGTKYNPVACGYDPWNATHLATTLLSDGVPMVEVRQGFGSLSAPSKLFEALVASGRLSYSGSPVTLRCVESCEARRDPAGNIKPAKLGGDARSAKRIDGVVASVMALSRLMVAPEPVAWQGVQVIRW